MYGLHDVFKAARIALRITREELSEASGVHPRAIARMEQGDENVRLKTVMSVRAILEREGVVFLDASEGLGPGFRLPVHKRTPDHVTSSTNDG